MAVGHGRREWPWSRDALLRFDGAAEAVAWVDDQTDPACACSVSYAGLVKMADRVSCILAEGAVSQGAGIGLCLDNCVAAVACQIGALWFGNHFVPLDEPSVQPRLREMLNASCIEVIFASPINAAEVAKVAATCCRSITVLAIDDAELTCPERSRYCMSDASTATATVASASAPEQRPCQRVCTFHTSGTTGTPKPIHSTAEQWGAFVLAAARPYHLSESSRVFVATSAIFDPSAGMTFAALALGATVCLAPWPFTLQHLRLSVELTRATHACSTPSVWALYELEGEPAQVASLCGSLSTLASPRASGTPLSTVMLGGEPTPAATIRAWLGLGVRLINTYGTDLP